MKLREHLHRNDPVLIANGNDYPITSDTVNGRKVVSKVDIPTVRVGVNYRF